MIQANHDIQPVRTGSKAGLTNYFRRTWFCQLTWSFLLRLWTSIFSSSATFFPNRLSRLCLSHHQNISRQVVFQYFATKLKQQDCI